MPRAPPGRHTSPSPPIQQEGTKFLSNDSAEMKPFGDVLASINRGTVADGLSSDLAELVNQVRATGRKGSITLKLTVAPFKGNNATLEVAAATSLSLPKGDPAAAIFYPDKHGGLHRNDPLQPQLPLNDLPRHEGPLA
jgi:hypothetical protein